MIAAAIVENVINYADAFIDFHSGGSGGRLQARVDYNAKATDEAEGSEASQLARAFGMPFVHENDLARHRRELRSTRAASRLSIPKWEAPTSGPENTALYRRQA